MNPDRRLQLIRIIDKIDRNPEFSTKLEVTNQSYLKRSEKCAGHSFRQKE